MNSEKIKTLEQVQDALSIVEDARAAAPGNRQLEEASARLRKLERTIIRAKQEELVAALTADSAGLKALSEEIKASAKDLEAAANAIGKATAVVEALIKIVSTAASAGLL